MHKIPVVLNAWGCKIQDGRKFENRTAANVIYVHVIEDLRGEKFIVMCFFVIKKSKHSLLKMHQQ